MVHLCKYDNRYIAFGGEQLVLSSLIKRRRNITVLQATDSTDNNSVLNMVKKLTPSKNINYLDFQFNDIPEVETKIYMPTYLFDDIYMSSQFNTDEHQYVYTQFKAHAAYIDETYLIKYIEDVKNFYIQLHENVETVKYIVKYIFDGNYGYITRSKFKRFVKFVKTFDISKFESYKDENDTDFLELFIQYHHHFTFKGNLFKKKHYYYSSMSIFGNYVRAETIVPYFKMIGVYDKYKSILERGILEII